ncbi:ring finger protein 5 [Phtheirospermum japonicum]|uniref:E3 ubiquitin-protein ligase RMA n=1 Tax=Phtheirospermum japonicum TaxID=374723 RepID=A0A830C1Z9_9LAMI|nr:ring finger protein 5 [Phtheirospermum japonicum]
MDSKLKKSEKEGGSFYDCNICLELAKDPILTCCGHLFCWPCFYQVSKIDSSNKECPVCKGEVSDKTVTPIYGNGDSEGVCVTESGLKIPPRPKAGRVESVRQQFVTQGLPHVPVSEALRRIRISIGAMGAIGSQTLQQTGAALSNAERLVEDLESAINDRVILSAIQAIPIPIRPQQISGAAGVPEGLSLPSLVRRRRVIMRNLGLDNLDSREPRRRRLN